MAPILQCIVREFLHVGATASTTAEKGRALEDLICYVFETVPGVAVSRRNEKNAFATEEIDVALWNDCDPGGFFFLPNIILVECKNWSGKVGSCEVSWFDTKLRNRGLNFGILVSPLGITGHSEELTAAHSIVAAALREGRRLVIISAEELLETADASRLILLIKEKLCDLAVKGTVG